MRKIKSVKQQALIDITKHNIDEGRLVFGNNWSDFIVGSKYLDTKENRKLNRELGIHKLNKARL
jgi:hypothetical protein